MENTEKIAFADENGGKETKVEKNEKLGENLDNLLRDEFINAVDLVAVRSAGEEELTELFVNKFQSAAEFKGAFNKLADNLLSREEKQEKGLEHHLDYMRQVMREFSAPDVLHSDLDKFTKAITRKNHPLGDVIPNLNLRETFTAFLERDREKLQSSKITELLQRLDGLDLKMDATEEKQYKDVLGVADETAINKALANHVQDASGIERVIRNLASLYTAEELFDGEERDKQQMAEIVESAQGKMDRQFNEIKGLENILNSELDIRPEFAGNKINSITRHNHIFKTAIPNLNLRKAVMEVFMTKINQQYPNVF